jgi:hypothetical protein
MNRFNIPFSKLAVLLGIFAKSSKGNGGFLSKDVGIPPD